MTENAACGPEAWPPGDDPHPRYVLLDQKQQLGDRFGGVVIYVLDTWYNYREVASVQGGLSDPCRRTSYLLRRDARRICDQFNAEHDAWLAEA